MGDCTKEYDCEQLLLYCGLSHGKSKQMAPALKAAMRKQDQERQCDCKTEETVVDNKTTRKKKDVNEVLDLRKDEQEK